MFLRMREVLFRLQVNIQTEVRCYCCACSFNRKGTGPETASKVVPPLTAAAAAAIEVAATDPVVAVADMGPGAADTGPVVADTGLAAVDTYLAVVATGQAAMATVAPSQPAVVQHQVPASNAAR